MKALQLIKDKIVTKPTLVEKLRKKQLRGEKIVFTNGCFDILHQGHVDYLSKASDLGDCLVVAINSDQSVKTLGKGKNRPMQDELSRAIIIASLQFVDYVIIFNENTPQLLIEELVPDILVKGSDYAVENIVGYEVVMENGGKVETIDFLPGYSTSSIILKAKAD